MDVCGDSIGCMWAPLETDRLSWIEHANNLFEKLQITGSQEHFGFTDQIHLYFDVAVSTEDPPDGYLFLCPREHFFPGATGSFVWPECPYFWSVDETGVERLRPEDASARGFPTIDLRMEVIGAFWDGTVYERVRKFHELKGYVTEIQTPPVWEISWANVERLGLMPKMVPSEDTAQSEFTSRNRFLLRPALGLDGS
ncbi:hypothetical protein FB45DRAFT_217230 [Roridomyces roridus]|uniref:Uncharacterized protein n=1 Tax=Roridomyces roridus TaxID=1738132 RepID=A0AAD7FG58_9AGAR|nr:hypothetical protein FB45DRAFT_217230 [Roridomyces roridus]